MIVVVGSPVGRRTSRGVVAGGAAVAVAAAAAQAGARVELVGAVAEGVDGDAILLSVASAGIGHVAVLRIVGAPAIEDADEDGPDEALAASGVGAGPDSDGLAEPVRHSGAAAPLDAGDLELALRYLSDYSVVVIAQRLPEAAVASVVDAALWGNAKLVAVGSIPDPSLPPDATVLEAPTDDPEGPFAVLVGRYAAALDRGEEPGTAFATASRDVGWTTVGRG